MALSGSRGTLDCSQTRGVLVSAPGCSSCQKTQTPKKLGGGGGRDHICNGLGSEGIMAKF